MQTHIVQVVNKNKINIISKCMAYCLRRRKNTISIHSKKYQWQTKGSDKK